MIDDMLVCVFARIWLIEMACRLCATLQSTWQIYLSQKIGTHCAKMTLDVTHIASAMSLSTVSISCSFSLRNKG